MKKLKFNLRKHHTKEEYEKMMTIAKRAVDLGAYGDVVDVSMDIEAGVNAYDINLDKLASFDDYNLLHDIYGLQKRINRGQMYFEDDCFLPRSYEEK